MTVNLRNPSHHRVALVLSLALGMSSAASRAQQAPLVDAVGAYHHATVMQHRAEDADGNAPPASPGRAAAGTISRRDFDALMRDLRVEYRRRSARDGQREADAWLHARVDELRKRYRDIRE